MASWRQHLKYTFRRLSHSRSFAAAAVLSIGLGIAANTTIFSMVSRFVLRPPPVGDPSTLLAVQTTHHGECCNAFSWPLFTDLRQQSQSFSGVAGYFDLVPASLAGNGEPERVWGQSTTTNFFDVTRLGMTLGRGFLSSEEHLPVIVLGYGLWSRHFGADPSIVGKTVMLSGRPHVVVGVAPPSFHGIDQILFCQFWVPLGNIEQLVPNFGDRNSRFHHWVTVVARLKPGVTRAHATAELNGLALRLGNSYPETDKDGGFLFESAGSLPPRDQAPILMFLGALTVVVLLVLAIACANVANLQLAQAYGRQREMAVRLALGANRRQLLQQMLTESVVLALGGGLLGVAISLWATQILSMLHLPAPVPLDLSLAVDWRVLLYTFVLSVGSGLLFGLVPAWVAARPIMASALKGEDALARPGRVWTLRNVLVVAQIAMSLVLLCATGLFLRSLDYASRIDVGFRSQGLLMMAVDPRLNGYSGARTTQLLNRLRDRVASFPGVTSVACTDMVPLSMGGRRDSFQLVGQQTSPGEGPSVDLYMATHGYFGTMGIPLIAGRDFSNEAPTGPKVAIVNEAFVKQVLKNRSALGQTVTGGGAVYQIVGVVKNIKSHTLGENTGPVLFRPLDQTVDSDPAFMGYTLLVRFDGDSEGLTNAVRREIHSLDPALAVFNAETMKQHLRDALFLPRLAGALFGVFGFVGLLLAAIGLYGVISYSVSRRTREIGIRLALGAQSGGIQRLIVRQGMLLTAIAMLIGIAVAWAAARVFTSFLYGVPPHDFATFIAVPLILTVVAFFACWAPSRRASKVEPLTALRYD